MVGPLPGKAAAGSRDPREMNVSGRRAYDKRAATATETLYGPQATVDRLATLTREW